jgi:type IV secretory pathway VirB10-like protein
MQDRRLAFVNGPIDRKTVSHDHLENPVSRYVVQACAVIPTALITGMRSDLPGEVTAQVTENVCPTGRYLVIPQGAKLIGTYDSKVAFGQDRLLLVWTRLIMPKGGLNRTGTPACGRSGGLHRPRRRGRSALEPAVHGGRALDGDRHRFATYRTRFARCGCHCST